MEIKYFIRTTGERVLNESYEQIPYTKLIDKDHRYVEFFIECLEYFSQWNSVFIEDDCILCRDFKNRIEEAIADHPNEIINFFNEPLDLYFKTKESNDFRMNQCTYYPKELTKKLAKEMRKVLSQFPDYPTDWIEDIALKNLNQSHIKYRPTLVQHIANSSILGHKNFMKWRATFFIDYYDDLNIDYKKGYLEWSEEKRLHLYAIQKIKELNKNL